MLSLVSTLAEDVNNVKFGLNHLAIQSRPLEESKKFVNIPTPNHLITVSDDEDSDSDEDSDDELELELEENEELELEENEELDEDSDEDSDEEEVKVLKIRIPIVEEDDVMSESNLDELDDHFSDNESNLDLEETDTLEEVNEDVKADLKTINIHLDETQNESMDYKKLPLPKLRTIVTEKGLASDSSKLKKNELLKLLESE